jgi:hypothetical protein
MVLFNRPVYLVLPAMAIANMLKTSSCGRSQAKIKILLKYKKLLYPAEAADGRDHFWNLLEKSRKRSC